MNYLMIFVLAFFALYVYFSESQKGKLTSQNTKQKEQIEALITANKSHELTLQNLKQNHENEIKAIKAIKNAQRSEIKYIRVIKEKIKSDGNYTCIIAINDIFKRLHSKRDNNATNANAEFIIK